MCGRVNMSCRYVTVQGLSSVVTRTEICGGELCVQCLPKICSKASLVHDTTHAAGPAARTYALRVLYLWARFWRAGVSRQLECPTSGDGHAGVVHSASHTGPLVVGFGAPFAPLLDAVRIVSSLPSPW